MHDRLKTPRQPVRLQFETPPPLRTLDRDLLEAEFSNNSTATDGLEVLGSMGDMDVRLATSSQDVRRAQRLRYNVFYREMSASPSASARVSRRDEDRYDAICDHLLVVDRNPAHRHPAATCTSTVVGTYRMLRQESAERNNGFYSQSEFNLAPLIAERGTQCRFLELGRSCVLKPYRTKRTLELLWQGLWSYIRQHRVSVLIGCASFEGTDPRKHAEALTLLHRTALVPDEWNVRAHEHRRIDMNMLPDAELDVRQAMRNLPPLIKGYLRVGCFVGDGAVVDEQFGTTDVLMILPVDRIHPRYIAHFTTDADEASPVRRFRR